MKDIVLLDADIICYRIGFTTQDLPQEIAEIRTDELIRRIVHDTEAASYKCYLSGTDNFRYSLYPAYKGNRVDKPKPVHLEAIREHLVRYHNASIINGWEADDELAIEQTARGDTSIIASIDKDLLQVPGWHWNFVTGVRKYVTPLDGLRTFYAQLIAGDGADNIPSYDGKIRNGHPPQFIVKLQLPLWDMNDELEMWGYVCDVYETDDPIRNAKLLYLLRKENDEWLPPNGQMQ